MELWKTSWDSRHIQGYEDECMMDKCRKERKRCEASEGHSGVTVKKIAGSVKGVSPIDRQEASLEKEGAHNIINGAKSVLRFTVLLESVWTRHTKDNAL